MTWRVSPGLERISSLRALLAATRRASAGRRHRGDVADFLMDAEPRCLALGRALRDGTWAPTPGCLRQVRDPKPRTITVIPFADRVVHQALMLEVEPELERGAVAHSYACRRGKGQHRALRRAQACARRWAWVFKADIASFFASIDRERLAGLVHRSVRDRGLACLLVQIVRAPSPGLPASHGLPVGSLVSQHLANATLSALDHHVQDDLGFGPYLRYMDDFLVFGSRKELRELHRTLASWLGDTLGLSLNDRVTRTMPVSDGVPFLGWRVFPHTIRPRSVSWRRWRARAVAIQDGLDSGALSEGDAAARAQSVFAPWLHFDTLPRRLALVRALDRANAPEGLRPSRVQTRESRRLLEQHRAEPARCEPQQEQPRQPQHQHRLPPRQHPPSPDVLRPRVQGLCAGGVPAELLCPGSSGTESHRSGRGGFLRVPVAVGPTLRRPR